MSSVKRVIDRVSYPKQQVALLIEVYEDLHFFNQHCRAAGQLIKLLGRNGTMRTDEVNYYRALLEEVRAAASQSMQEYASGQESYIRPVQNESG